MLMGGAPTSVAPSVAHEAETNIAEEKRRDAVAGIPSPLRMALRSGIGAPPSGLVLFP
jgi:hypothetical protein